MHPRHLHLLIAVGLPVAVFRTEEGKVIEQAGQITRAVEEDVVDVTVLRPGATTLFPIDGVTFRESRQDAERFIAAMPEQVVCFLPEHQLEREAVNYIGEEQGETGGLPPAGADGTAGDNGDSPQGSDTAGQESPTEPTAPPADQKKKK